MHRLGLNEMMEAFALHEAVGGSGGGVEDFRFLEVNAEFERLTGKTREQLLGQTVRSIFPGIEESWLQRYAEVNATGTPFRQEVFSRFLDRHLDLRAFRTEEGHPAVAIIDVSERLRAIEALRESERRSLRLIETLRRSESTLAALLDDKAALLKEVHHRVKNNLQVIVSLMNIERGRLGAQGPADDVLVRMQDRVLAMAEIHDALYRSPGFAAANMVTALRGLASHLADSYDAGSRGIVVDVSDGELLLPLDYAVPCCLAMNELITNSLRYAFPADWAGSMRIDVHMDVSTDGSVEFTVKDNGQGLPLEVLDADEGENIGGLRLARLLADQVDGSLSVSVKNGTVARLSFALP